MSLLVIAFFYLDCRDGEMVAKELAAIDYTYNRVNHISLRDLTHGMKCLCLTRELIKFSIMFATGMTATYCILN